MSETRTDWGLAMRAVLVLVLVLVLAACGSGHGLPSEKPATAEKAEPVAATAGSERGASNGADATASSPSIPSASGVSTSIERNRPAEDSRAEESPADPEPDGSAGTAEDDKAKEEAETMPDISTDYPVDAHAARAEEVTSPVLIVLDPGHGGDDTGAIGGGIVERESNLNFALRVEQILLDNGFEVLLTRRDGKRSQLYPHEETIPALAESRIDLQARVDLANQVRAEVYVAIHSNRSPNPLEEGVEVWYDPNREHSLSNIRLSARLLRGVIAELLTYGYPVRARGILNAECHEFNEPLGICLPLFVLAPPAMLTRTQVLAAGIPPDRFAFQAGEDRVVTRSTAMPAALVELLFISNNDDAKALRDNDARQAIARGIARAIMEFVTSDDRERPWEPTDSELLVG